MSEAMRESRYVLVVDYGNKGTEAPPLAPFDADKGYMRIFGIDCPECFISEVGRVSKMQLARGTDEGCTPVDVVKAAGLLKFETIEQARDWFCINRARYDLLVYLD